MTKLLEIQIKRNKGVIFSVVGILASSLFTTFDSSVYAQTQIGQDIDGESAGNFSGHSISLNQDGSTVAIAAIGNTDIGTNAGQVKVYSFTDDIWNQKGSDLNGNTLDNLGASVSLSNDGNIIAIGAPQVTLKENLNGYVRLLRYDNGAWSQIGRDIIGESPGDQCGMSVSLSGDGNTIAVGARNNSGNGQYAGHVRVYTNLNGDWTQVGSDIDGESAGDHSGWRISLSSDGNIVAIGANRNSDGGNSAGHVRVYKNMGGRWTKLGSDIDGLNEGDASGSSVSLSSDGTVLAIGSPNNSGARSLAGRVRVFKYKNETWTQLGTDIEGEAVGEHFGWSVSLNDSGSLIAIGAIANNDNGNWAGQVRLYKYKNDIWNQIGSNINGEGDNDQFGGSVSLSGCGNTLAIGAQYNDGNGTNAGHVRVYDIFGIPTKQDSIVTSFIQVYPNPILNEISIEVDSSLIGTSFIFYNAKAQVVFEGQIASNRNSLEVEHLAAGVYVLQFGIDLECRLKVIKF